MADTFKNSSYDADNTNLNAIYTVPTATPGVTGTPPTFPTTALVKSILVSSDSANATLVDENILIQVLLLLLFYLIKKVLQQIIR